MASTCSAGWNGGWRRGGFPLAFVPGRLHTPAPDKAPGGPTPSSLSNAPRCVRGACLHPLEALFLKARVRRERVFPDRTERTATRRLTYERALEVVEIVDVRLKLSATAIAHQDSDAHPGDDRGKDGAARDIADPHPAKRHGLLQWPDP